MLGAVPPIRMVRNAFLVGEAVDHIAMVQDGTNKRVYAPRYSLYFMDSDGGYHYGGLTTIKGFDLFVIKQ